MRRNKCVLLGACLFILFIIFLFCSTSSSLAQGVEKFENLGLYGGQIATIAIDPTSPDKIFAGSYLGDGLFISTDGGGGWEDIETNGIEPGEDEFNNHTIYSVKIAPSNPQVVWAVHDNWVEMSIDGGLTWNHILNSVMQRDCENCGGDSDDFRICKSLAIDPADHRTVYVGTGGPDDTYLSGAIYKTTDEGETWSKMNKGIDFDFAVEDIDIDPQDRNTIWIVTNSEGHANNANGWGGTLYQSENGGENWSEIYSLTDAFGIYGGTSYLSVTVKPDDSNTVFTGGGGTGILIFSKSGGQWIPAAQPCSPDCMLVNDIVFDPQDPETAYAMWLAPVLWGGDGIGKVARTTDGGINWDIYAHDYDFASLAVHPSNSEIIFAGELNEGMFKSSDHGQSWTQINKGINAVIVYDIAIDPNDSKHILASTFAGLYEKKNSGLWSRLLANSTRSVKFHPTNSMVFFVGVEGQVAKTLDGGQNWSYSNSFATGYNFVSDIAIDPTNSNTIYISIGGFEAYGKIYISNDEGDIFHEVLDGENLSGEKYDFNTVAIDPSDNQHIFAGGGNFYTPKILGDLWESKDGGESWTRTSLQNVIVNALLINPSNPLIMYAGAGYSGGMGSEDEAPLYKSIDGGATWLASFDGIPGYDTPWSSVTDLDFHKENKEIIYASSLAQGIYVSNQATEWLNLGVPKYHVYAIATSSLYAATEGGLLQLTGTGVITGKVLDESSQTGISGANIFNDLGAQSISVDGDYIMVSPAGTCTVTAVADNHSNIAESNVLVLGGDVAWVDIVMESGMSDPSVIPGEEDTSRSGASGGKACFVATAAYGSAMSREVEILRDFRDTYLLPHNIGKKLVRLYYNNGKPAAEYLDSHSWLKPLVRILLYPLIGISWLMLSTSVMGKIFMGLCFMTGLVVLVHTIRGRRIE